MVKRINVYTNASFAELECTPGELVALDNADPNWPSPLLLTLPKKIIRGHLSSSEGLRLLYCPQDGKREEWTIYPEGQVLGLWSPLYKDNKSSPHFEIVAKGFSQINPYFVENAMAGREAITQYLQERADGLNFYAEYLESGKLVTQRGRLEKLVQQIGLGSFLPDQLRFKN